MNLIEAANAGDLEQVEALLAGGADVNQINWNGITALMSASNEGHINVVDRLISAGADADKDAYNDCTALILAADGGHVNVVDRLISAGVDVNKTSCHVHSALRYAVIRGFINVAERLIAAGATVTACDLRACRTPNLSGQMKAWEATRERKKEREAAAPTEMMSYLHAVTKYFEAHPEFGDDIAPFTVHSDAVCEQITSCLRTVTEEAEAESCVTPSLRR